MTQIRFQKYNPPEQQNLKMRHHKKVLILGLLIAGVSAFFLGDFGRFAGNIIQTTPQMATIKTNFGDIKIQLHPEQAPKMVENFQKLAQAGKYDGVPFHRVIDGFMIQGGDFENQNGTGGTSWTGKDLTDEFSDDLSHVRGAVSMANRGPNTNGSQFFIVQADASFLDGRHSIFGQVVEGMEVVDQIAKLKTDLDDRPLEKAEIESVEIL